MGWRWLIKVVVALKWVAGKGGRISAFMRFSTFPHNQDQINVTTMPFCVNHCPKATSLFESLTFGN